MRATRWNAVVLFDECDIFMAQRDLNLERSSIVGVFLKLLDYYKGMIFLTTNRSEVIDRAFKSRITLSIKYPDHTPESRLQVWKLLLDAAELKISNGGDMKKIAEIEQQIHQLNPESCINNLEWINKKT